MKVDLGQYAIGHYCIGWEWKLLEMQIWKLLLYILKKLKKCYFFFHAGAAINFCEALIKSEDAQCCDSNIE